MDKSALRGLYLKKRKELSPEEIDSKSQAILKHFSTLKFDEVEYLHIFYPIAGKREFNSLIIADWMRHNHPKIKLVLSKSNFQTNTLSHSVWDAETSLQVNAWGITEPETGVYVSAQKLDMILVPLLVFDKDGNRVGYGKGFYDRFLAECKPGTQKIGVSFFPPVDRIDGVNEYDIRLDLCITAEKIVVFNDCHTA